MAANITTYGFLELKDLASQRIITIDVRTLQTAIRESVAEWSRQVNALLALMVTPTTDYKIRYQLPGGGSLQPLDEKGNPKPVQPSGVYDVALPIQGAGTAWGGDRVVRAMMTVEDADRATLDTMQRDYDWLRRHILAAVFTNTTWTYTDPLYGALTIQPLANGDTVTYVRRGGTNTTDTHYLAQAAAIADASNPFPTIYSELDEHPSNNGRIIAYVPTNLVASIETLTALNTNFNTQLNYGADVTTIAGVSVDLDDTRRGDPFTGLGDRFIGLVNGVYVVEWAALPDNYIIAMAESATDVVGMREYPAVELQGFFPEFHDVDGNTYEYRMIRYAGFGVLNRVGALVYRIGNAAYAIPTGYTAPLVA